MIDGAKVGPRPLAEHAATKIGQLNRIPATPFCKLPVCILNNADLSAMAKIVFAYLLDRQGRKSVSWPSQNRIANDCGTTKPAIIRAVVELESHGLLSVRRPMQGERGRSNRYQILIGPKSKVETSRSAEQSRIVTEPGNETRPEPESVKQHSESEPRFRTNYDGTSSRHDNGRSQGNAPAQSTGAIGSRPASLGSLVNDNRAGAAGRNGPNVKIDIICLLGDRGCDESFRQYVAGVADPKTVRPLVAQFDRIKDQIRNPGAWWRAQLRNAGVPGL